MDNKVLGERTSTLTSIGAAHTGGKDRRRMIDPARTGKLPINNTNTLTIADGEPISNP